MAMLLGKKIGMTQVYDASGKMVPVTVIQAGPCTVTQVKTTEADGYRALQLGYEDVKKNRIKKPQEGHAGKAQTTPKKYVREWRLTGNEPAALGLGEQINVASFAEIKFVDVVGVSKGKGTAGVMKRHGFGGFPASHGTERKHRAGGSIGSHASDRGHGGNLKKGKRMGGRMGCDRVTSRNHQLVMIDEAQNLLVVKGAIPGPSGGYVQVYSSKKS